MLRLSCVSKEVQSPQLPPLVTCEIRQRTMSGIPEVGAVRKTSRRPSAFFAAWGAPMWLRPGGPPLPNEVHGLHVPFGAVCQICQSGLPSASAKTSSRPEEPTRPCAPRPSDGSRDHRNPLPGTLFPSAHGDTPVPLVWQLPSSRERAGAVCGRSGRSGRYSHECLSLLNSQSRGLDAECSGSLPAASTSAKPVWCQHSVHQAKRNDLPGTG